MPCKLVQVAAHLAALGKQGGNSGQGFFAAACNDDRFLDLDVVDGAADEGGEGEISASRTLNCPDRIFSFVPGIMQNRKKYDAFNLSATFIGFVCEFPQVSMTKMILRIKLPLTMLKVIANALQKRVGSNYRFVLSFNSALILLGALGILPPATSAMLHNLSTLGISLRSMTDLLEQKPSL